MMKTFEKEYIELCLKHANRKHMSKARTFNVTAAWAYRCMNRVVGKTLDIYTGKLVSPKSKGNE